MKAERKRTFLEQLRAAFVIVIMIPVLCLGGFIFYSSHRYIKEQRLMESSNLVIQNQTDLNNWAEQFAPLSCGKLYTSGIPQDGRKSVYRGQ